MSADTRTDPPTPDPLTAEEEKHLRARWETNRMDFSYNAGRWLATLDATRGALSVALDRLTAYVLATENSDDPIDTNEDREFIREARYDLAALPSAGSAPDQRLLTAVEAAILNIQHNRIGAAVAGLRVARDLTRAALSEATTSPEATLDVAWREAEAALPEGAFLLLSDDPPYTAEAERVHARQDENGRWVGGFSYGEERPTPAAALSALAARLRGPAHREDPYDTIDPWDNGRNDR